MRIPPVTAGAFAIAMIAGSAGGPATAQRWDVLRPTPPSYRLDMPTRPTNSVTRRTGSSGSSQPTIWRQVDRIDDDIRAGRASGQLTRREARRLRRENAVIGDLAGRYGQGGLSGSEARELQVRTEVMRDIVNNQRLRSKP